MGALAARHSAMRSEDECLARAIELECRAAACGTPECRALLLGLAQGWRGLAQQACWQDS